MDPSKNLEQNLDDFKRIAIALAYVNEEMMYHIMVELEKRSPNLKTQQSKESITRIQSLDLGLNWSI